MPKFGLVPRVGAIVGDVVELELELLELEAALAVQGVPSGSTVVPGTIVVGVGTGGTCSRLGGPTVVIELPLLPEALMAPLTSKVLLALPPAPLNVPVDGAVTVVGGVVGAAAGPEDAIAEDDDEDDDAGSVGPCMSLPVDSGPPINGGVDASEVVELLVLELPEPGLLELLALPNMVKKPEVLGAVVDTK